MKRITPKKKQRNFSFECGARVSVCVWVGKGRVGMRREVERRETRDCDNGQQQQQQAGSQRKFGECRVETAALSPLSQAHTHAHSHITFIQRKYIT